MPDALLLDWEGCIVDTSTMRHVARQRALQEEGLAPDAVPVVDPVVAGLVAARASRAFAERLGNGFLLRDGARELLESAQVGSRIAIVTRASRSETEFVLRLAGLDSAVSTIVSGDDAVDAPPSLASFLTAIARLSQCRPVRVEQCLLLATSIGELRAARTAGLRTIALGAPAHIALEADAAVDSLTGLTLATLARLVGLAAVEHGA
jgi:beta-phosphoglucomutase-like phosphatase (HAD superfamily)